jgi:hypothetical protein
MAERGIFGGKLKGLYNSELFKSSFALIKALMGELEGSKNYLSASTSNGALSITIEFEIGGNLGKRI